MVNDERLSPIEALMTTGRGRKCSFWRSIYAIFQGVRVNMGALRKVCVRV
jgi:hypothetical protein